VFILPPPYPLAPPVQFSRKSSPSGTWRAILETAVPTVAPRTRSKLLVASELAHAALNLQEAS
jgi:hypothetical protein